MDAFFSTDISDTFSLWQADIKLSLTEKKTEEGTEPRAEERKGTGGCDRHLPVVDKYVHSSEVDGLRETTSHKQQFVKALCQIHFKKKYWSDL